MKKPNLIQQNKLAEKFNSTFKVGDKCNIRLDDNSIKEVTIRHTATIMGGHTAVGWFDRISGSYSLDRVVYNNPQKQG